MEFEAGELIEARKRGKGGTGTCEALWLGWRDTEGVSKRSLLHIAILRLTDGGKRLKRLVETVSLFPIIRLLSTLLLISSDTLEQ